MFVVTSTRTGSGRITPQSDEISSEDLAPLKARILLMLAIATTDDSTQIQRMFQEY